MEPAASIDLVASAAAEKNGHVLGLVIGFVKRQIEEGLGRGARVGRTGKDAVERGSKRALGLAHAAGRGGDRNIFWRRIIAWASQGAAHASRQRLRHGRRHRSRARQARGHRRRADLGNRHWRRPSNSCTQRRCRLGLALLGQSARGLLQDWLRLGRWGLAGARLGPALGGRGLFLGAAASGLGRLLVILVRRRARTGFSRLFRLGGRIRRRSRGCRLALAGRRALDRLGECNDARSLHRRRQ